MIKKPDDIQINADTDALRNLDRSCFDFHLGGSAFFGATTGGSDIDFYTCGEGDLWRVGDFLLSAGFAGALASPKYQPCISVFKHPSRIDVLVMDALRLEAMLHFQQVIRTMGADKKIYNFSRGDRKIFVPIMYGCALEAMLTFRPSDEVTTGTMKRKEQPK